MAEKKIAWSKSFTILDWGCMNPAGVRKMVIINGTLDHRVYVNILKQNLGPSAETLDIKDNFAFPQDNDTNHRALKNRLRLLLS